MDALFTSLVRGAVLRRRVLDLIAEAAARAETNRIDLHVMTFAFTDEEVARTLADVAAHHPSMTVRVIADWSQRIADQGQQLERLAQAALQNLQIRYKKDQPYVWDPTAGHMRWSYHASRGLLHHKTLGVLVDGRPWRLICGSFNWTAHAARSYENLLIVTDDDPGSRELMSRVELEFEALWSDGRATLSPREAHQHYQAIVDEYRRDAKKESSEIVGLSLGAGEMLTTMARECYPPLSDDAEENVLSASPSDAIPRVATAFSSRRPDEDHGQSGYADLNRLRRFFIHKPSGRTKRVPLTLTTLALDTIFRSGPGDTLKVAMYGLSMRVAEYGALLDAARRGVRVFVLLDREIGEKAVASFTMITQVERLPIEVRTVRRMMHQKYVIHPESATVLTGTANMTTDATARHSEQRIVIRGCRALADQFSVDFETIWARLSGSS